MPAASPASPRTLTRTDAALLIAPDPPTVLRRLLKGDPYGLAVRCRRRLIERALILDAARLQARAMALCAWKARDFDGSLSVHRWVEQRVDEAIDQLLEQGALATPGPLGASASAEEAYSPGQARRAAARFNRCPQDQRSVLLELVRSDGAFEQVAQGRKSSWSEVAKLGRGALLACLPRSAPVPGSAVLDTRSARRSQSAFQDPTAVDLAACNFAS